MAQDYEDFNESLETFKENNDTKDIVDNTEEVVDNTKDVVGDIVGDLEKKEKKDKKEKKRKKKKKKKEKKENISKENKYETKIEDKKDFLQGIKKVLTKINDFFTSEDRKKVLSFIDTNIHNNKVKDAKKLDTYSMIRLLDRFGNDKISHILNSCELKGLKDILNMDHDDVYLTGIIKMFRNEDIHTIQRVLDGNYEEIKKHIFMEYYYENGLKRVGSSNIDELYRNF